MTRIVMALTLAALAAGCTGEAGNRMPGELDTQLITDASDAVDAADGDAGVPGDTQTSQDTAVDGDGSDVEPGPDCGNGILDAGETCDGDCPESCPGASACTLWTLEGSAELCNARCVQSEITVCQPGDGCCAAGCSSSNDSDCAPQCGNGVVEGSELCDGNCPTREVCTSSGCILRQYSGEVGTCDARCVETTISACSSGDGCCPDGCTAANDSDCVIDCRNAASWPPAWVAVEDAALVEINAQRAAGTDCPSGPKNVAASLTMDPSLREAARCHSLDMVNNNFFSHTGSDGSNFAQRANQAGFHGSPRYENIAAGNGQAVPAVGQWMTSTQGHCDALMDGSVTRIGLGYAYGANTMWGHYWTAVLGQ